MSRFAICSSFAKTSSHNSAWLQLDLISYSSYDSQCRIGEFATVLAFIEAHHNKTEASPTPGLYVGEYGLPEDTPAVKLQVQLAWTHCLMLLSCGLSTAMSQKCYGCRSSLWGATLALLGDQRAQGLST
jgi:hypothetical protein